MLPAVSALLTNILRMIPEHLLLLVLQQALRLPQMDLERQPCRFNSHKVGMENIALRGKSE